MNKKKKEDNVYEELIKIIQRDLDIEKEQSNIVCSQGNGNIMTISVLSVTLTVIIFELIDKLKNQKILIIIFSSILIFVLFLSLFFATLSHFIYKQAYPASPRKLIDNINNKRDLYEKDGFYKQNISDLTSMYESLRHNNHIRKIFLRLSFIGIWSFLGLFVIFGIVLLIVI